MSVKNPGKSGPQQAIVRWLVGALVLGCTLVGFVVGMFYFLQWQRLASATKQTDAKSVARAARATDAGPPTLVLGQKPASKASATPLGPQQLLIADDTTVLVTPDIVGHKQLLEMETGQEARPNRMACSGNTLYFLARGQLYRTDLTHFDEPHASLQPESLMPEHEQRLPTGERIRELLDLVLLDGSTLVLLDKSNDIYRYNPASKQWGFALKAQPSNTQPDPHYVALSVWKGSTYLLDYARNQIQRLTAGTTRPYFPRDVMSWEIKAGDPDVAEGIDLFVDSDVFVLTRTGELHRYRDGRPAGQPLVTLAKIPQTFQPLALRALRGQKDALYVVDAGNRRILQLEKGSGALRKQWFLGGNDPEWDHLHDVVSCGGRLLALAGNQLVDLPLSTELTTASTRIPNQLDDVRLQGFIPPVPGALLPDNAGIYPGARRLYRYGIHEGADFFDRFNPQDGGKQVYYGAPVVAIQDGRVLRADQAFKEIRASEYPGVLADCKNKHETSRVNEDRFRGRQVWIEHPGGVVSIYAHLSAIPPTLKVGQQVHRGEKIGAVGNTGTSNSIAGTKKNAHLHLEIWLNQPDDPLKGEYLGKWLSLSETRELWERVFGAEATKQT